MSERVDLSDRDKRINAVIEMAEPLDPDAYYEAAVRLMSEAKQRLLNRLFESQGTGNE